jgi:arylsulfatase A-like enzyme
VDVSGRRAADLDTEGLREQLRLYYAEVELVDATLGRILELLAQLERPTLVVFTADHGEGLGDRGWLHHTVHLHDELIRVPLIVWRSDRALGGRRIRGAVGLVDVAPTIGELAGLRGFAPEDGVDGRSLAESVERGAAPELRDILSHRPYSNAFVEPYRRESFALRRGRWKLMRAVGANGRLFDLEEDPGETRNVRAQHAEVAAALDRTLDERVANRRAAIPAAEPTAEIRDALKALGYAE